MTEVLKNAKNWQQVVAEYQAEIGDMIPKRQGLEKFAVQPSWLNGRGADFHQEAHLARVLVNVNAIRVKMAANGDLPKILQHKDWIAALNGGAVGHDLELTNDLKDYADHGLRAMFKLPQVLRGIISSEAIDFARLLCYWHVPDDSKLPVETYDWFKIALWILKDADSIDRIRFPRGNKNKLDVKYIRLPQTLELFPAFKELWRRTQDVDEINPSVGFNTVLNTAVEIGLISQ